METNKLRMNNDPTIMNIMKKKAHPLLLFYTGL